MKKKRKKFKYCKSGAIIGFIVGLLPLLAVFDSPYTEIFMILLAPLTIFSRDMLFIVISAPIFYVIIGSLIGVVIDLRKAAK